MARTTARTAAVTGLQGRGPYCGDNTKQDPPEKCDDGVNQTTYGGAAQKCAPGCVIALYCGDGTVSNTGERDDGTAKHRCLRQMLDHVHARPPLRRRDQEWAGGATTARPTARARTAAMQLHPSLR